MIRRLKIIDNLLFSFCISLISIFALSGCSSDKQQKKPNIIFIMADDLGYHDLGCYGQEKIMTPYIDQLAREGTSFTQCYTGCTVCAPSRSVLMTGQHMGHTTVRGNFAQAHKDGLPGGGRVPLKDEDITVAEMLKNAGYKTGITGKWGLGEPGTMGIPNKQGFDEWFGYLNQRNAHSYYPEYLWKNKEKYILEKNKNGLKEQYSHDLFTKFALEFIRNNRDTSFFLYIPYTIPHAKYEIPSVQPYENEDWPEQAKVHAAMVTRMDRDVGKIMNLLDELNISEHTLVFFCSDNGAARFWEGLFNSSGKLKGRKRDLYEGGIRTPMIVRFPGVIPRDRISDAVWYFPDIMPTLAEVAGTIPPANIDGINVWPVLKGASESIPNRYLYWEFFERGFQQAARYNQWKAIKLHPDSSIMLFDLENDIHEDHNIARENEDIVQKFDTYFDTARTESHYWPVINKNSNK